MNIIFLDIDGVICLYNNWGSKYQKQKKIKNSINNSNENMFVDFDDFDKQCVEILNDILIMSNAKIVISSDWRLYFTIEELGNYFINQGIIKKPDFYTKKFNDCKKIENFPYHRYDMKEQLRVIEIQEFLNENININKWVAVDDMNLGNLFYDYSGENKRNWGLDNFVHTWDFIDGLKMKGIKERIITFFV